MSTLPPVTVPLITDGSDVAETTRDFLSNLNLLPSPDDLSDATGFGSALKGPPDSVSLIEAGATALTKWWAAGAGTVVLGLWGSVRIFWADNPDVHQVMLSAAGLVTVALVLAIAWLLASDVRGRADASVATIQARSAIGVAVLRAALAQQTAATTGSARPVSLLPLVPLPATNLAGKDSSGWMMIAMRIEEDEALCSYLLVKAGKQQWVAPNEIEFATSS
jgi:hypothetical protein